MSMVREGVPAVVIADKMRRDMADPESRKQPLGHPEQVIEALGKPAVT